MSFYNEIKKRIQSNKGESISETLVALAISALALMILAGMITTASRLVKGSAQAMSEYYEGINKVERMSEGTGGTGSVILRDSNGSGPYGEATTVTYFSNGSNKPVISYKRKAGTSTTEP